MRRLVVVLAVSALFAVGVGAASGSVSSAWTGFGAPLSDWIKAHPKNSTGCPAGGCYGGRVKNGGELMDQFVTLQTDGQHRVVGYEQSIGDGTPIAAAKQAVLALFPPDTKTTAFWIAHDSSGNTCARWNLQSPTLAKWLAKDYSTKGLKPALKKLLGTIKPGSIGVDLSALGGAGYVYKPNDVPDAVVDLVPNQKGGSC